MGEDDGGNIGNEVGYLAGFKLAQEELLNIEPSSSTPKPSCPKHKDTTQTPQDGCIPVSYIHL